MAIPQSFVKNSLGGNFLKTLILALDGLDISYVDKFKLDKFKQESHGIYDVGTLERVFTPIVFAAVLSGKDPRTFGYTQNYITKAYERGYPSWIKPFYWVRRNIFGWVRNFGIRDDMAKAGIFDLTKVHRNLTTKMKERTIFNKLIAEGYKVNPVGIPSYNEEFFDSHAQFPNYINKDLFTRKHYIMNIMDFVKKTWLTNLTNMEDYDLTFIYSPLPDIAHHLITHETEIELLREVYSELSTLPFLFELKNTALLIMSDHGYEHKFREDGKDVDGDHHPLGFWSLNVHTDTKPVVVFDFYDLIYELVTIE